MTKYFLMAGLLACLGLSGWSMWLMRSNASLDRENQRLERVEASLLVQIDWARRAARVSSAHVLTERSIAKATATRLEAIQNLNLGDCASAKIPDDLADILGRRHVPAAD